MKALAAAPDQVPGRYRRGPDPSPLRLYWRNLLDPGSPAREFNENAVAEEI
jgi:hypothetical protein